MKKLLLLFCVFFIFGLNVKSQNISDVYLKNNFGKLVTLDELAKDKSFIIVSFWSTSCSPCLKELDAMNEIINNKKKFYSFEFIAISVDDSKTSSKVYSIVKQREWDFKVLIDYKQELKRLMNAMSLPSTYVIDKHGNILITTFGYVPGAEDEIFNKIDKLYLNGKL